MENLKETVISDQLTYLLRNLYSGQEETVRTGHRITGWSQIRRAVHQGCLLSLYLFNLYAEDIIQNTELNEAQAGIKIARRTFSNFTYADGTILMEKIKN